MFRIVATSAAVFTMALAPASAFWAPEGETAKPTSPPAIVLAQATLDADENKITEPGNLAQELDRNTDRIQPAADGTVAGTVTPGVTPATTGAGLDADENKIDEPGNLAQELDRNTDRIQPAADGTTTGTVATTGATVTGGGTTLDADENVVTGGEDDLAQELDRNTDRIQPAD